MPLNTPCITRHIIVVGKVQGVFFRAYTKKKACQLGITGWVKNKSDGSVEIMATRDAPTLDAFLTQLHQGSLMSTVNEIKVTDAALIIFKVFEIKKDT